MCRGFRPKPPRLEIRHRVFARLTRGRCLQGDGKRSGDCALAERWRMAGLANHILPQLANYRPDQRYFCRA